MDKASAVITPNCRVTAPHKGREFLWLLFSTRCGIFLASENVIKQTRQLGRRKNNL